MAVATQIYQLIMIVRSIDNSSGKKRESVAIEATDANEATGLAQLYSTDFAGEALLSATLSDSSGEIIWQTRV